MKTKLELSLHEACILIDGCVSNIYHLKENIEFYQSDADSGKKEALTLISSFYDRIEEIETLKSKLTDYIIGK